MKYYRAEDGTVFAVEPDGSQDRTIRPGWVAITPDQVAAQRAAQQDPKAVALARIRALELDQLLPRATREFMLLTMESDYTPEQLAMLEGYVKLKAFDTLIAGLRAIVRGEA
jgi:hypothetical protein